MSNIETPIREKCGVFGVSGERIDASRATFFGLLSLQHRGLESTGIAISDGESIKGKNFMGQVVDVFDEKIIRELSGTRAIGHVRYGTSGGSLEEHMQPRVINSKLALAHNGNLPSTRALEEFLFDVGVDTSRLNDSAMMAEAVSYYTDQKMSLAEALREAAPLFTGAYSIVALMNEELAAMRDPHGIRPLSIGRIEGGWVFASETVALDAVGAKFEREVSPGEIVVARCATLESHRFAESSDHIDAFEYIYFSKPDSRLGGKLIYQVREKSGYNLAQESPVDADLVMPVPETAIPAAIGFARGSGIPFSMGIARNEYAGRTFIQPGQALREAGVDSKLNPMNGLLKGKRVVIVDDSIVRGTNSRKIVERLRDAGVAEVHFRVASPPIIFPDYYGIDLPTQRELVAYNRSLDEIRKFIGADSLGYLSVEGLVDAISIPQDKLSLSCFTGVYPIDIRERAESVVGIKTSGSNRQLAMAL